MVTDLWRHPIHNSRGAWHTLYSCGSRIGNTSLWCKSGNDTWQPSHVVAKISWRCGPKKSRFWGRPCVAIQPPAWCCPGRRTLWCLQLSTMTRTDERRPAVRQWLRIAELQGEHRYENRINNNNTAYIVCHAYLESWVRRYLKFIKWKSMLF